MKSFCIQEFFYASRHFLQANIIHKIYHFLSMPFVFRGKLCFQDFWKLKNNTSNFRCTVIFSSEKCVKVRLKLKVIQFVSGTEKKKKCVSPIFCIGHNTSFLLEFQALSDAYVCMSKYYPGLVGPRKKLQ